MLPGTKILCGGRTRLMKVTLTELVALRGVKPARMSGRHNREGSL